MCGDAANMAREVNTVLAKIISEQRGIPESKAEDAVKSMRSANQYQVHRSLTPLPLSVRHFAIRFAEAASEYPLANKY